jgi:hypothetical protein
MVCLALPVGASNVQSLAFRFSHVVPKVLAHVVKACRQLQNFIYHDTPGFQETPGYVSLDATCGSHRQKVRMMALANCATLSRNYYDVLGEALRANTNTLSMCHPTLRN